MAKPRPRVMVFAPAAVLIVYGAAAAEVRGLRRPPQLLQRIGDASYSIYLIHTIVLLACIALWIALPFRFPRVPWLLGMFVTAVGLGTLFYRCVERPLLNLVKRKKPTVLAAEPSAIDAQPLRKVA